MIPAISMQGSSRSSGQPGQARWQLRRCPDARAPTVGAKSGKTRVNPMMYREEGARRYVFASKASAPSNPDWFYNLLADPNASIEVGSDRVDVVATVVEESERERIDAEHARQYPGLPSMSR